MSTRYKIVVTEYSDEIKTRDGSADAFGYAHEIAVTEQVEREIYVQNTSELDLKKVILSINGG